MKNILLIYLSVGLIALFFVLMSRSSEQIGSQGPGFGVSYEGFTQPYVSRLGNENKDEKIGKSNIEEKKLSKGATLEVKNLTNRKVDSIVASWEKAILTAEEVKAKKKLLSDLGFISEISERLAMGMLQNQVEEMNLPGKTYLSRNKNREPQDTTDILRLRYVRIIDESLKWQDNPNRIKIAEITKQVILAENITEDLTPLQKGNIAGDKVELFQALLESYPEMGKETWAIANEDLKSILETHL